MVVTGFFCNVHSLEDLIPLQPIQGNGSFLTKHLCLLFGSMNHFKPTERIIRSLYSNVLSCQTHEEQDRYPALNLEVHIMIDQYVLNTDFVFDVTV